MKKDLEQVVSDYQKYKLLGENIDSIVSRLREEKFSMIDTIKVVRMLYSLNLGEAKKIVSEHSAWVNAARSASLFEQAMALGPDSVHSDWLETYRFDISQKGKLHVFAEEGMKKQVGVKLESVLNADEKVQRNAIRDLSYYPDGIVNVLIALLYDHDSSLWHLIISALREIGFPKNVRAIPWLVDIAIDPHPLAMSEAIETLKDMSVDAVLPFIIAILLRRNNESSEWGEDVNGVCRLLKHKIEWMLGCGPSIAYLLSQNDHQSQNGLDREAMLSVLEAITSSCIYAIPVIYRIALLEKETEVGKKANTILSLFSDNDLRQYRYRLDDLL